MSHVQALTRDGTPWVPMYLESIDPEKCIGCGRCQKVCNQGVIGLQGLSEDGDVVEIDDEEMERLVSVVVAKGKCIGCNACARVCSSKAMTHVAADAA
jgi:Nif-specific ferredoxin III